MSRQSSLLNSTWLQQPRNAGSLRRMEATAQARLQQEHLAAKRRREDEGLRREVEAELRAKSRKTYNSTAATGFESPAAEETEGAATAPRHEFRAPLSPLASKDDGCDEEDAAEKTKEERKMGGRHNKGDETWHRRSAVIFCMLHPKAWGSLPLKDSTKEACKLIGYGNKTIYNWLALPRPGKKRTLKTCMVKNWWYITNSMTWADVKAQFNDGSLDDFGWEIEDPGDVQQELEKYADYKGEIPVLSKFDCSKSASTKCQLVRRGSHVVQKVKKPETRRTSSEGSSILPSKPYCIASSENAGTWATPCPG